ncbi:hypothetical protein P43SY_004147 [Pythium insidiosum]|uniref:Prolyl endopeptidase n=1 Tax=Pythium insidiosum TaxID=114742 RepID=A0AAD5Q489_PYTIN|nr:hypothetical protein P43SY_004147 [Pythium insidiosum]
MVAADTTPNHLAGLPEAIPLRVLYGNPDKRMPRISPDGKYYAYLADDASGVTNVFIKPVQFITTGAEPVLVDAEAQQVTKETHRPLRMFQWSESLEQRRILYVQDKDGDENFHLFVSEFMIDDEHKVHDLTIRDLTPFGEVTVSDLQLNKRFPDFAIVSVNNRDPRFFDAVKVHLSTGEWELLVENPGDINGWYVDDDLKVVAGMGMSPADGSEFLRSGLHSQSNNAAEWKTVATWPHGEQASAHMVSKDGKSVFIETSLSHTGEDVSTDTTRLVLLSLEDGKELEVIAHDDKCDVKAVSFNKNTRTIEFVTFDYTKPRIEVIDEDVRGDIEHVLSLCSGEFQLVSASADNQTWMYADGPDNASLKYYIYDRRTRQHALLFDSRPELAKYTLVPMTPHVIKTSDDEDMVIYVSLPHGVKAEKLPFVLNVHGGPWARDTWGFDPTHQHFANRGYGCISVNFRSSTGYGKRWQNLGDLQWGARMQQDLTDTVEWAIKQGLADPARVAIFGGSYGGYAALAGLTFTPDLYACSVDIVGPSHVKTLFETIPPYWSAMKKMLVLRVGDVENDEEWNQKISPLFHVDKIKKPLLIAQGANDPRVKQAESDQIAKKMFEKKLDVKYVLYKDEGHGFARPQNRLDFTMRAEEFLAEHLGGRKLPRDEELVAGNSAVDVDPSTL